jgi:hypothetical protein
MYSFAGKRWIPAWTQWVAVIAVVAILPISGSRGFVLSFGLLLAFALLGGSFNARLLRVTFQAIAVGGAIFGVLIFTSFFKQGLETFSSRWNEALGPSGSVNDAIVKRFFSEYIGAFNSLGRIPLFGYGIGLGSNFGSAFSSGALIYMLAESEWERTVLEMGPVVGVVWLGVRCGFGLYLLLQSWRCLRRGHVLPWLLFGTVCLPVFNGFLQQPTSLGFLVFTTGLCYTAIKLAERDDRATLHRDDRGFVTLLKVSVPKLMSRSVRQKM